jgi:hypothetical protein
MICWLGMQTANRKGGFKGKRLSPVIKFFCIGFLPIIVRNLGGCFWEFDKIPFSKSVVINKVNSL